MSTTAINWVFQKSQASGLDRLVFICLADETNSAGLFTARSVHAVAKKSNLTLDQVARCLDNLGASGELVATADDGLFIRALENYVPLSGNKQIGQALARKLRAMVADRDGWICRYCHSALREDFHDSDSKLPFATLDHIFPASLGGGEGLDNLALACRSCNSIKGSRPVEYMAGV